MPGTPSSPRGVEGLDEILARLTSQGFGHDPVETYGNGVRHVDVHDPDGNTLSLAEAPSSDTAP
ncbi:hypothetical protein ABZ635_24475 [Nocardiopsis sp. NPDC007018]|uniref:VOC family protein n=1 Tax=Nocardiopsis sp. NPDC007018 TaxID=3155721 RepID=UPI0033D6C92C